MKCALILALFIDNGLVSSVRERSMGAFDTLGECRVAGHAALIEAAPLVRGNVRRIEVYCECRGSPDVIVGRAPAHRRGVASRLFGGEPR
jgi:hypothetical protein